MLFSHPFTATFPDTPENRKIYFLKRSAEENCCEIHKRKIECVRYWNHVDFLRDGVRYWITIPEPTSEKIMIFKPETETPPRFYTFLN